MSSGGYSFWNQWWSFPDPSNLRPNTNPSYTSTDFLNMYPQFGNDASGTPIIPTNVLDTFITMANGSLNYRRYYSQWTFVMGLFIAHYCTLWLETYTDSANGQQVVGEAGRIQGVSTSQSVGDVSESVDINVGSVDGWGQWNATAYGRQLATIAKGAGKGGMYVW